MNDYFLHFSVATRVRNKGDRGTTIGYAVFYYAIGKQQFQTTQDPVYLYNGSTMTTARIRPNDRVRIDLSFQHLSSYDKLPKQENIPFTLILYHAHGAMTLKGISKIKNV